MSPVGALALVLLVFVAFLIMLGFVCLILYIDDKAQGLGYIYNEPNATWGKGRGRK